MNSQKNKKSKLQVFMYTWPICVYTRLFRHMLIFVQIISERILNMINGGYLWRVEIRAKANN